MASANKAAMDRRSARERVERQLSFVKSVCLACGFAGISTVGLIPDRQKIVR